MRYNIAPVNRYTPATPSTSVSYDVAQTNSGLASGYLCAMVMCRRHDWSVFMCDFLIWRSPPAAGRSDQGRGLILNISPIDLYEGTAQVEERGPLRRATTPPDLTGLNPLGVFPISAI